VLSLPAPWARTVQVDGQRRAVAPNETVVVHSLPADVSWWPDPPPAKPRPQRTPLRKPLR
jgi:hypothetical protein